MKTEYIASGEYYIACNERLIIKALLGSCVGVALYDKESDVGGIIHLLLPEPISQGSGWCPDSYASSGLPVFIEKLLESGAKRKNMKAVIAGGALFGVVSQMDISLNIGGRTIEKVLEILNREGIPIVKEESSGFLTSVLSLDASNWEASITTNVVDDSPVTSPPPNITSEDIDEALNSVKPIPQAALKVIRLVSGDYDMGEVAEAIMSDQVLGAKVLKLCNSALFGTRRHIDSLEQALLILGEGHLVEMVVSAAVDSFLEQHKGGYSLLRGGLYRHAVGVAYASKVVAGVSGGVDPGTAYTAGLLHDIGKIVLDQYFACFRPDFYRDPLLRKADMIDLEKKYLGVDHQDVGMRLAGKWKLPDNLQCVVGNHHCPEKVGESDRRLASVVYLADILTTWFLAGMEHEKIETSSMLPCLEELGMQASQLPEIIDQVPWGKLMYL